VGIKYPFSVHRDFMVMRGASATGNKDIRPSNERCSFIPYDFQGVRIGEASNSLEYGYVVTPKLRFDHFNLARHDRVRAKHQVLHGNLVFHRIAASIERPLS